MDNPLTCHSSESEGHFSLLRYINEPMTHTGRKPRMLLFIRAHGSDVTLKNLTTVFDSDCIALSIDSEADQNFRKLSRKLVMAAETEASLLIELTVVPTEDLIKFFKTVSKNHKFVMPDATSVGLVIGENLHQSGELKPNFYQAFDLIVVVKGDNR